MAGQLDSLLKSVAKDIVATLGSSLSSTITYIKKGTSSYNIDTKKGGQVYLFTVLVRF